MYHRLGMLYAEVITKVLFTAVVLLMPLAFTHKEPAPCDQ